jgi:chromosomal replication initiator protein
LTLQSSLPTLAPVIDESAFSRDPEYSANTFESFVVSQGYAAAWGACVAVADGAGDVPNPLFVIGPVGSGKSHLLHAVAQRMRARRALGKIQRIPVETYVEGLIAAIRSEELREFDLFFRSLDALLLDDLLFSGEKAATEETIFLRLGDLVSCGVQVVVACDARAGAKVLERLARWSFARAAIVELAYPDCAARAEIVRRAATARGWILPESVIRETANRCAGSPRQLQSLVARITVEGGRFLRRG